MAKKTKKDQKPGELGNTPHHKCPCPRPSADLIEPLGPEIYPERLLNTAVQWASNVEILSKIQDIYDDIEWKQGIPHFQDPDTGVFAKAKLEILSELMSEFLVRLDNPSWVQKYIRDSEVKK